MSSIGALASFSRSWRHQLAMQVATFSVLVGSFTVLAVAFLVHQNLERFLTQWGRDVKVNVYLKEEVEEKDTAKISEFLSEAGLFSSVTYVSKKDAAARFKARAGQYVPDLLADLEFDNPLPASFELVVESGVRSSQEFDRLVEWAKETKKISGVDEVSYGQGWVENYASVLHAFSLTSTVIVFVLLAGSLFVVGNSIRNAIGQRRDEIEIMELFGATRWMIIWPYVFEGLLMGFMAAVVAVICSYGLYLWQTDIFSRDLNFWNMKAKIEYLTFARILLTIFLGTALGGLGSYLWIRKVSTGWAAAETAAT